MRSAFSLVELSIVLVILGLITGSVLVGQSLIRASELRVVMTEFEAHQNAVKTFKSKYDAIPGDFIYATDVWGTSPGGCPGTYATPSTDMRTCNGNDNRLINPALEAYRFWQHLANAGLIEGSYTGVTGGSMNGFTSVAGGNVPRSKFSNAAFSIWFRDVGFAGSATEYAGSHQNFYFFGAVATDNISAGGVLRPEEAWGIDKKIDDGRAGYGKVLAHNWDTCTLAGTQTDLEADYDLTNRAVVCALQFPRAF